MFFPVCLRGIAVLDMPARKSTLATGHIRSNCHSNETCLSVHWMAVCHRGQCDSWRDGAAKRLLVASLKWRAPNGWRGGPPERRTIDSSLRLHCPRDRCTRIASYARLKIQFNELTVYLTHWVLSRFILLCLAKLMEKRKRPLLLFDYCRILFFFNQRNLIFKNYFCRINLIIKQ